MFLIRTVLSDISTTSRLPVPMNGRGGVKDVLQFMSNHWPIEQPEAMPMPKGYETVRLPQLDGQLGLVLVMQLP